MARRVRGGVRLCPAAGLLRLLLIDGVIHGVWTFRPEGGVDQLRVEVFGRTGAGLRRRPAEEVSRVAEVLECDLKLSVGPADIAAHL